MLKGVYLEKSHVPTGGEANRWGPLTEVSVTQGGRVTIAGKEGIVSVDTLEIIHNAEGESDLEPISAIDEVNDGGREGPDFVHSSLAASSAVVLVSKFSNPNG